MFFLTKKLIEHIQKQYENLDIDDGDSFFGTFGPGNTASRIDRPYERFQDYEELLNLIWNINPEKYKQIHKGTPFFFLAWCAFDLRNYEKALFYIDAAISEDIRKYNDAWTKYPAYRFLKLQRKYLDIAKRSVEVIQKNLDKHIERFNNISRLSPITFDNFIKQFVDQLLKDSSNRTIISAFYVFLLENGERKIELTLKSTKGSSLGPIISNLFSGCHIFESLLKIRYPKNENDSSYQTIERIFKIDRFKNNYGIITGTSADKLETILKSIHDDSLSTAFSTTAKLRNTTGHNLVWDNIFDDPNNFTRLSDQIINALLFLIHKEYMGN